MIAAICLLAFGLLPLTVFAFLLRLAKLDEDERGGQYWR